MDRKAAVPLAASLLLLAACGSTGASPQDPGPAGAEPPTPVPVQVVATPGPAGWTTIRLPLATDGGVPAAIAALGHGYIAVGGFECAPRAARATPPDTPVAAHLASTWTPNPWATPAPPRTCYGGVWSSPDGLTWVDLTPGLAIPVGPDEWAEGGPAPGFDDVAVLGDRVVIIGRDRDGSNAWWGDTTGGFAAPANRAVFARTDLAAVTAGPAGFVIVGTDHAGATPRAAAWTSADGAGWTRVPDAPAFDVGVATPIGMEGEEIAGGMRDVTAGGPGLVAIGQSCDEMGACVAAAWTSADGSRWARAVTPADPGAPVSLATGSAGAIAVGGAAVLVSVDGTAWTSLLLPAGVGPFDRVAASTTGFVALQGSRAEGSTEPIPRLWASGDGRSWEPVSGFPEGGAREGRAAGLDLVATPGTVVVWGDGESALAVVGPTMP